MKTEKVVIALPKKWVSVLRKKAHEESLKSGREILYTDLIRTAIKTDHGLPSLLS